jgi:hypothetical protein
MKINAHISGRSRSFDEYKGSLTVLLPFLLLFSAAAVHAQFTYTTNAGGTSITITGGPGGAVNIPGSINGLTVTSIGEQAFGGYWAEGGIYFQPNVLLTSVTIPGSVTNIGDFAFYYCSDLTQVTISNGLIEIGVEAFYDDYDLRSITIPGSVANIGEGAFENCASLSSLSIPGTVLNVGDGAFANCSGLTNAVMMEGVPSIGNDAFLGCTNLSTVTIAGSVTNIGSDAFESCTNLASITIPGSVGTYAFAYCTSLTNATLSNGVGSIGDYAFYECGGLNSIVIPGSVNTIGVGAFASTSLTNLTISNGVSVIGAVAFGGCDLLTSVTFPPSVTSIGVQAFWWCNSLANVFFQGNGPDLPGDAENGGIVPFVPPVTCYYLPGTTGWSYPYQWVPFVLWNPLIQTGNGNFGVQKDQFGFDITGTPAIPIVVEASTNLANPVWTALTNVTLTNGLFHFSEPLQAGSPARYYRIGSP